MTDFKVGDRVRLRPYLHDNLSSLYFNKYLNQIFTVVRADKEYVLVDNNMEGYTWRFEKVDLVYKVDKEYEDLFV